MFIIARSLKSFHNVNLIKCQSQSCAISTKVLRDFAWKILLRNINNSNNERKKNFLFAQGGKPSWDGARRRSRKVIKCWKNWVSYFLEQTKGELENNSSLFSHSSELFHSLELAFVCFSILKSENINILQRRQQYSNVFDLAERWKKFSDEGKYQFSWKFHGFSCSNKFVVSTSSCLSLTSSWCVFIVPCQLQDMFQFTFFSFETFSSINFPFFRELKDWNSICIFLQFTF